MLSLYHLATTLLALGPLANATLLTREQRALCSSQPGADILALNEQLAKGEQHLTRRDAGELIPLDAWVHVVHGSEAGPLWVTKEKIAEEMKLLNNAYAPSNLTFNLVNTTWTKNATWAMHPKLYEKDLKTKLHRGTSRTLNLYYVPGLWNGGVCTFPNMNAFTDEEALAMDGCMVGTQSLPGGSGTTGGLTTVHEVGHWFGLLHTFHGGCDEKGGDFIADTPAEASPANDSRDSAKCPVGRDTCPDLPGLDPIDNYMDYTYYKCRNRFTPGQTARMRGLLSLVRLGGLNKREID